MENIKEN